MLLPIVTPLGALRSPIYEQTADHQIRDTQTRRPSTAYSSMTGIGVMTSTSTPLGSETMK